MEASLPVGFYPFWFWNATLEADEIRRQVAEMAAQGVRGFFIHSRQGLGQPYLSEAFFEMVDVAVEAAEQDGLLVHLYDEYPYPSGVAGGEVVLGNPEYQATSLVQRTYDLPGGPVRLELPRGKVLACVAVPLENDTPDWEHSIDLCRYVGIVLPRNSYNEMGLTQYNRKRYFASEPTPTLVADLPEGAYRLFVSVQTEVTQHKYWDHFVDALNPDAIRHFISLTHERYYARYADRFGSTIRSIFVDEIQPGWSARLPAAFEAATGRDLLPLLPALQAPDHPEHLTVAQALQQVRYDQFCEGFETQISTWCRDHGIAYAGEKGSLRMAQLRYMDIPGCDPGHTKVGVRPDWLRAPVRRNAKSTASAAYFYGKEGALCECYHSLGWSATLQDAKAIADGLLLAGIRYLVPHGFFYSTHGLVKHDAPPTFFFQMPFWSHFGRLSDHIDRVAELFEGTHIDADIFVVDISGGLPSDDKLDAYALAYENLLWALMRHHLDFHIVDTDILVAGEIVAGATSAGDRAAGTITCADVTARVVIVPPMQVIEPALSEWLSAFRAAGGVVIVADLEDEIGSMKAEVADHVAPSLSIREGGHEAEDIVVVKRVGRKRAAGNGNGEERSLWFALNLGTEPMEVTLKSGGGLRELALEPDQPPKLRLEGGRYLRHVAPFEGFMVEAAPVEPLPDLLPVIHIPFAGPAQVSPKASNLLRLGTWQMALQGPDGTFGPTAEVQPMPLAMQLTTTEMPFAPAFRHFFGRVPEMALPALTVRYSVKFDCDYEGPVSLVMEPGSLAGDWRVTINTWSTLTPDDFAPVAHHVRGSLGADVTDALHLGVNRIEIEVTTDQLDGGLLNPIYLAGDFGVTLDPLGIIALQTDGGFETYEDNLLPFYAGVVDYTMTFHLNAIPEGPHALGVIESSAPFHEACDVAINGGPYRPVLWEPREVVVPTALLREGENRLDVRVATSLIRSFEGQWFDYHAHRYRDVGDNDV